MKVYRCLNGIERKLFELNYICSRVGKEEDRSLTLNTHDYGQDSENVDKFKSERVHYFLFLEDAIKYLNLEESKGQYISIGEYEIPDELVINNIGCGYYAKSCFEMNAPFILETAIPYIDLVKEFDHDAYEILLKGAFNCSTEAHNRHCSDVLEIRNKLGEEYGRIPTRIAKCMYCDHIVTKEEENPCYKDFIDNYGIVEIMKALNIKIITTEDDIFDKFDLTNKQVDIIKIKEILKKYNLLEQEKIYKK